jgi:hypothetical protein
MLVRAVVVEDQVIKVPITVQSRMFRAAKSVVVPWRM